MPPYKENTQKTRIGKGYLENTRSKREKSTLQQIKEHMKKKRFMVLAVSTDDCRLLTHTFYCDGFQIDEMISNFARIIKWAHDSANPTS